MKYALLNHLPLEQFEARKDPALISAWKSYVEAIQASGVLMESVGLQPPDKATMVSVRSGKRHVHDGPYAESKELLLSTATKQSSLGNTLLDLVNIRASQLNGCAFCVFYKLRRKRSKLPPPMNISLTID
jgi:hypothetical protein